MSFTKMIFEKYIPEKFKIILGNTKTLFLSEEGFYYF